MVLIVDDVAINRILLKVKLAAACYEAETAADGASGLAKAREMLPDLVLLDFNLPDIDGIEVCLRLKSDPRTRDIAVVMISASPDPAARLMALRAGAEELLEKPFDETLLMARLRSLLRARETEAELRLRDATCRELGFAEPAAPFAGRGKVALVAATREAAVRWKHGLAPHLGEDLQVVCAEEALAETARGPRPEAYVIAAALDQPSAGLRLMSELRSRPSTRHAAMLIVMAPEARETAAMALDLGAGDLVFQGASAEEMALRIQTQLRRKRAADRLRETVADGLRLAVIDPLTGLYNRRYAIPHIARIANRTSATGRGFALMALDLDRFKSVNDGFGHAAGDAVLVEVAARLRANLRAVDLIARVGGEEFLVALPDSTLEAATATAERLRQVIDEQPVHLPGGQGAISVTVSIGLAMGEAGRYAAQNIDEVLALADTALRASKSAGRNQVTLSRSAA